MATGAEIASAYVTLHTRMPGVKRDIEKELGAVDGSKQGRRLGQRFGNALAAAAKIGAVAAGAAIASIGVAGFRAAVGIETSQRVLGGLYGDAEQAKNVLQQLRDVGRDSPIDYAAYTQAAETLAYAGIKGDEAVGVLENVGMAITAAGGDSENMQRAMGGVMQAVNNGGIAMMDSLNRISEAGVPILSGLGEHFGVTIDEVRRMASAGEVNITDVMSVLQNATGDTFDQMITAGEAAEESFGNTWAAVKDNVITTVGEAMVPILEKLTPILKTAGDAIAGLIENLASSGVDFSMFTPLGLAFETLKPVLPIVVDSLKEIAAVVGGALGQVFEALMPVIGEVLVIFSELVTAALPPLMSIIDAILPIVTLLADVFAALAPIIAPLVKLALMPMIIALKALTPIFDLLAAVITPVAQILSDLLTPAIDWMSGAIGDAADNALPALQDGFTQAWAVIKPIFEGIADVAVWVWETILKPVFNAISVAFAIVAGIIVGVWQSLIRPAIQALGKIFKWLWATIVKPVFDAIGKIFKWVWNTIIKPIVDSVKKSLDLLGKVFTWLWANAIKPSLDNVGSIFRWLKNTIIDPIWNGIKNTISNVWNNGIKPVIDRLVKVVKDDPKKAFEAARDGITKAWDKIKDAAKTPVKFVINTVINGLIGTINKIPGVNIPKVKLPAGFHDGGYTGSLPTRAVAGVVHGDEYVLRSRARRSIESNHPGALEHMNRFGQIPGFSRGGYVNPLPRGSYSVSQPFHAGHNGIDLAAATGTKIMAAQDGRVTHAGWHTGGGGNQVNMIHPDGIVTWYAHMSRIQTQLGAEMKRGQTIGRVGSTGNSTGPHLHYMIMPGGWPNYINPAPYMTGHTSPEGDGWNPLSGLVDWVATKIKDKFPSAGMWVDAAAGIAKDLAEKAVSAFTPSWGDDDGVGGVKPTLFDRGGWLQPGRHLVENRTGRPEPILTGSQWAQMLESRADRGPAVFNLYDADGQLIGRMRGEAQRVSDRAMSAGTQGALRDELGVI